MWALNNGMKMREIKRIFVHCSASMYGDVDLIDEWHKAPPHNYRGVGYHAVVTNGRRYRKSKYDPLFDGLLQTGRLDYEEPAAQKGHNDDSLAICLVGNNNYFTVAQVEAAVRWVRGKCREYWIPHNQIFGHYQVNPDKTCPMFNIDDFRRLVRSE